MSKIGNNFVHDETSSAVDRGVGLGKYAMHLCHSVLTAVVRRSGLYAHSRRMGRWNASVDTRTRPRKNRYCSPSEYAWSTAAFVMLFGGATSGLADDVLCDDDVAAASNR